jgi:hypothetical protein
VFRVVQGVHTPAYLSLQITLFERKKREGDGKKRKGT